MDASVRSNEEPTEGGVEETTPPLDSLTIIPLILRESWGNDTHINNGGREEMKRKQTLWTKNYTCITLATFFSIIGGEVMTVPLSLLVFEQTQSTILSAIIFICGVLPDLLLSVFVAPIIDKSKKKQWIVGLDILMMALYVFMGFWIANHEFQYLL